jgi:hypothetical protein
MRLSILRGPVAIAIASIALAGCASSQLNYNTLDLASSSNDLITSQVLSNLGKFRSFPYALPSQVSIPSGSASTTNTITPTISGPLGPSVTTTLANSAAAPLFNARTNTHLLPNATAGVTAGDQWSQNWTLTPLEDPDQLRRLRALYRFGAGFINKNGLACDYPLVQKAGGGGASQSTQTVNVYVDGKKTQSDSSKPPPPAGGTDQYTSRQCPGRDFGQPDPAFLKLPGCVLCTKDSTHHELFVNPALSNQWLWNNIDPLPQDALLLGPYSGHYLYLVPHGTTWECNASTLTPLECAEKEYGDFVLFILEATLQSTSASGGSGGKGTPQKGPNASILQQPAAPTIQLLQ